MGRLLLLLPFCLILDGQRCFRESIPLDSTGETAVVSQTSRPILEGKDLARQQLLASLAMVPQTSFPASLPWAPLYQIGDKGLFPLECILVYQPIQFLDMCLEKYDREVHGYTVTFRKQERINKKLQDPEKIRVSFREKPFSVLFDWQTGAQLAQRTLYVKGENKDLMQVRPNGLILGMVVISKDPEGPEARQSSHYTLKEFGLQKATQRTLAAMRKANARGALHVRFEGLVRVAELHDRLCYKFVRTPYDPPEEQGLYELTFYIDQEHWLQVGSILRDVRGELISEYFFCDLIFNPEFPKDLFTSKSL